MSLEGLAKAPDQPPIPQCLRCANNLTIKEVRLGATLCSTCLAHQKTAIRKQELTNIVDQANRKVKI